MDNNLENAKETGTVEKTAETELDMDAKVKALEAQIDKLKTAVTNASADASKWKQTAREKDEALKAKMSDEERAKVEQENATAAMQKELEDLRTERNIANYTASLSASDIGMNAETAKAVAEALNAGDIEKVFVGIREFIVAHDKALRGAALANNPTLTGGSATEKTVTREQFKNMSLSEMQAFKAEFPDLYTQYTK